MRCAWVDQLIAQTLKRSNGYRPARNDGSASFRCMCDASLASAAVSRAGAR